MAAPPVIAGALEPVEEVGYKNRPPLLENVAIEGPLRVTVPHALDTLEQRDAIEEDYNWWRYSKFAAPWLFFLALLFLTILISTAYQQVGDLRGLKNGVPRYLQLKQVSKLNTEAGIPKKVRNLRIAGVVMCLVGAVLSLIAFYSKPRPKMRKLLYILYAFILFVGAVLLYVAFGIAEDNTRVDACNQHELQSFTYEACRTKATVGSAALATDFALATSAVLAAFALVIWGNSFFKKKRGWRQQERDLEASAKAPPPPGVIKAHGVRPVHVKLISIALALVILFSVLEIVWIILLHMDHNVVYLRSYRGRADNNFSRPSDVPYEKEGWPASNTRLRYAWSSIGLLVIIANFIPWRSRIIAYIFAFIYLLLGTMAMVSFGIDVSQLRKARDLRCPDNPFANLHNPGVESEVATTSVWATAIGPQVGLAAKTGFNNIAMNSKLNCVESPFVATAIIEFIVTVAVIIYLLNEYILRWSSVHSQRKYPWFQIKEIENELDSRRPIRCELTSQVMTAKEYYYKHRFLAGPVNAGSVIPTGFVDPILEHSGYGIAPMDPNLMPTFGAGAYGAPAIGGLLGAPTYGSGYIPPIIA
jgi:hypothetical protein